MELEVEDTLAVVQVFADYIFFVQFLSSLLVDLNILDHNSNIDPDYMLICEFDGSHKLDIKDIWDIRKTCQKDIER